MVLEILEVLKIQIMTGINAQTSHVGSLGSVFFTDRPVRNYDDAKTSDTEAFGAYCRGLFDRGIYAAPSQFEAMFLSLAHTPQDLDRALSAIRASL